MTPLPADLESFVAEARVARLATVEERGHPNIVPVCFVYFENAIYSVLDAKPKRVPATRLRRVRNLLANPHVQLLIDRYDEDWSRLAFVQLRGRAGLLQPGPEHAAALAALRLKYPPYASMSLDGAPIIKLIIERCVSWGLLRG